MGKILIRDHPEEHELIRRTRDYYERNAEEYFSATAKGKTSSAYQLFLDGLPKNARILDAGCGSGRDTAFFLRRGYDVSAFDASVALCRLSTSLTRVSTRQLRFQELDEIEEYDGVWASASLLHVPRVELPDCVSRLIRALKPGGVMYMSFKHGSGERFAPEGRFFADQTSGGLQSVLDEVGGTGTEKSWVTPGTDVYGNPTRWVNALIRKTINVPY
ncbi:MAG: class I SAM-dependent methyltransferase [Gammaproteobacteria bacterium]|nr:class I SAM-dependent methyltransferase [Gammaproteobacteria bacterium]